MISLKEAVQQAQSNHQAIGHFNISSLEVLWAIFEASKSLSLPVIIGVSEGEREFLGVGQVKAIIDSIKSEFDYPIFLNADHTYSFEKAKLVIDAGYDSLVFDAANKSIEENISLTKQVVEYAKSKNPDMLIEAELGYIGSSSKLLDEIPEGASVTSDMMVKPEEAKSFLEATGVDMLAPAVGNIHGMLKNASNPEIDTNRVAAIKQATGVPLVLHGGSGISDANFIDSIKSGISIIHINTEIRKAWREALSSFLTQNPDEVAPYKILKPAQAAVQQVVVDRLKLFANLS